MAGRVHDVDLEPVTHDREVLGEDDVDLEPVAHDREVLGEDDDAALAARA